MCIILCWRLCDDQTTIPFTYIGLRWVLKWKLVPTGLRGNTKYAVSATEATLTPSGWWSFDAFTPIAISHAHSLEWCSTMNIWQCSQSGVCQKASKCIGFMVLTNSVSTVTTVQNERDAYMPMSRVNSTCGASRYVWIEVNRHPQLFA